MHTLLLLAASAQAATTIQNTSDQPWVGVQIEEDGQPVCVLDSVPVGAKVVLEDGHCQLHAASALALQPAEEAPAEAPPTEESAEALHGVARVTGGFGPARRLGLTNTDDFTWTGCTVTLNGEWSYVMPRLAPNVYEGIMLARFQDVSGDIMTRNHTISTVELACDQGQAIITP